MQCNNPVHTPHEFAPHAISTPHKVHQQPSGMANIQPQIVQPVQAQNQAVMQPCIAQPAAQQQPALKPFYFDFVEMEHWFLVDPAIHTMMGANK